MISHHFAGAHTYVGGGEGWRSGGRVTFRGGVRVQAISGADITAPSRLCDHVIWSKLRQEAACRLRWGGAGEGSGSCHVRAHTRASSWSCRGRVSVAGLHPARARHITFFIIEVPKGHPQPGSPKDGPCKGPNEVRLNTECTRRVHSSRIVFFFS